MGKTFNYEDLENWTNKWDKALEDGIFEKPDAPPVISKQSVQQDFFNMSHDDHDEYSDDTAINECDTKYWADLYKLTKTYGRNNTDVVDSYLKGTLKEQVSVDKKSLTNSLTSGPNPIRPSSIGNDNGVSNPVALGTTYDVGDLQKLEDLKSKLHGLIDKLNGFEAHGQNMSKLENQIESMKKKIDEISDGLSKGVPSQQGD